MTIPHDATCDQCRFYHGRTKPMTEKAMPYGDCYGLPPQVFGDGRMLGAEDGRRVPDQWHSVVADLRPACSLFEAKEEPDETAGSAT